MRAENVIISVADHKHLRAVRNARPCEHILDDLCLGDTADRRIRAADDAEISRQAEFIHYPHGIAFELAGRDREAKARISERRERFLHTVIDAVLEQPDGRVPLAENSHSLICVLPVHTAEHRERISERRTEKAVGVIGQLETEPVRRIVQAVHDTLARIGERTVEVE